MQDKSVFGILDLLSLNRLKIHWLINIVHFSILKSSIVCNSSKTKIHCISWWHRRCQFSFAIFRVKRLNLEAWIMSIKIGAYCIKLFVIAIGFTPLFGCEVGPQWPWFEKPFIAKAWLHWLHVERLVGPGHWLVESPLGVMCLTALWGPFVLSLTANFFLWAVSDIFWFFNLCDASILIKSIDLLIETEHQSILFPHHSWSVQFRTACLNSA